MKPVHFLGQAFAHDKDFKRAYPAYAKYVALVRAGADTPHKIEAELFRLSKKLRPGKPRYGSVHRRKSA